MPSTVITRPPEEDEGCPDPGRRVCANGRNWSSKVI